MSDSPEPSSSARNPLDPSSMFLSSLYGMNAAAMGHPLASALAGLAHPSSTGSNALHHQASTNNNSSSNNASSTLGLAASQAASLGANAAWYAMAQQLAAQDYMARFSALAAAQQQAQQQAQRTHETTTPKRGRKKAASNSSNPTNNNSSSSPSTRNPPSTLDSLFLSAALAANNPVGGSNSIGGIPSGLTIERKKTPRNSSLGNSSSNRSPIVDRVEITKVPMSNGGTKSHDEAPLNLSLKTTPSPSNKIPSDYYASQALSGAFLAEQIRQSQLAAALESRLEASSSSAAAAASSNLQNIQALLMNKLKAATPPAAAKSPSRRKKTGLTVASLLSKQRNNGGDPPVTQEEVDKAEKSLSANPELTIEPIFKKTTPVKQQQEEEEEDNNGSLSKVPEDEDEEGKIKIKNVNESPEIRNLSDQEDSEESESGRVLTVKEELLRLPLAQGWKRESLVREYSKSGYKGDVFYYAPCGKKFKQYSELLRYLEKRCIRDLTREHFSFSTRVHIGEFLKPTGQRAENGEEKYLRLSEVEMQRDLEVLRKENGWVGKSGKPRATNGKEDKQILLETLVQNQKESSDALLHRDAMKLLKEAERMEAKKNQEAARAREREIKRQQALFIKDQERERRRQHMIFIKLLEGKRRCDERERRREDIRLEKERDRERRIEQRRLEYEIITELKKPCEDMSLVDEAKPIPEMERINGMLLSGDAFANVLMIHEFVHNFGDILGFDMDALPSLSSLQLALLNDPEYEEELLSIVIHLVVCAIEDPGIPTPNKHLTLMGQNLRQADITNTNISEILKIYLFARGQAEVRACQGFLPPPDFFHHHNNNNNNSSSSSSSGGNTHHLSHYHYYKDRKLREEGPNLEEYRGLLAQTKPFKMSEWVKDKPFLSLNPLEKTEIVAFLCNELLGNKAVMAQVDNNLESIATAKKRRWATENKLKKLRVIQQRKFKPNPFSPLQSANNNITPGESPCEPPSEMEAGLSDKEEEEDASLNKSFASLPIPQFPKRKGRPPGSKKRKSTKSPGPNKKRKAVKAEEEEPSQKEGGGEVNEAEGSDEEGEDDLDDDIGEEEEQMTQEELQKKVEKTLKLLNKRREDLIVSNNRFRASDLGQDRFRRRYWHLAFSDGIFVEGMESSEPWKLETEGMPSEEKKVKLEALEEKELVPSSNGGSSDDEEAVKKEEEEETKQPTKKEEDEEQVPDAMKDKNNSDDDVSTLKITPNGDKLNLFNHSAQFNMSLSPVILNGSVTITPKGPASAAAAAPKENSPWFSILPMGNPLSENPSISSTEIKPMGYTIASSVSTHIEMLEKKLASIRGSDEAKSRIPIPAKFSRGWWRITSSELLRNVEYSLHPRGSREHSLLWNLKKCVEALVHHNYDGSKNSAVIGEELTFELNESLLASCGELLDENGAPKADEPGKWSPEVALRVERYILEQVEALEDKVAAASMQVPGWKLPNREDIEERVFRPSCSPKKEEGALPDPISEAKERLLDLEQNIERRYLKAPLGYGNNEPTLQTITTSTRTTMNSSKTPLEESQAANGADEENGHESGGEEAQAARSSPEKSEEALPRGLQIWRDGVAKAKNAAQLAMGFYVLETSIAWHKSIMKAFCQLCHSGDNEDSLLLCDGCDKGYHMYCFKPSLTNVPDGDWYCFECINKATGIKHCLVCGKQEGKNLILCSQCPRAYHTDCLSPALSKSPRGKWQCPACQSRGPSSSARRKQNKRSSKALEYSAPETEDTSCSKEPAPSSEVQPPPEEPPKPKKSKKAPSGGGSGGRGDRDLSACSTLLSELENSEEAWPFLYPVNTKQFPTYRKVIKNPMDIATIKRRLDSGIYRLREDFCTDVRQIFANCEIFNEDDSPVGKAGHAMRTFFEARWTELTNA